jgi:predicted RND superfamily exporter protein
LIHSAQLLIAPVTWACVTDAVGFAALTQASVQPVRNFGIMMAVGSLCVLLSAGLLIPGLALWGHLGSDPQRAWGEGWLDRQLKLWASCVARRPWQVAILATAVSGVAICGVQWLEVETDFTRNFRDDTAIVRSYQIVESKLGGAGLFDVILPVPKVLDWNFLARVLLLEQRLRREVRIPTADGDEPALTKVLSVADVIVRAAPTSLARVRRGRRQIMINAGMRTISTRIPELLEITYTAEAGAAESQRALRIMLRARERQPAAQKQQIINQVVAITNEEFPAGEVTGFFVLLTNLVESVVRDQWRTFAVALIGIGITMVLAFRSLRFALVALVPNGIPILMVMGLMGWLGLHINMGAAMIAAVSVGLSVDSSIHYITAFRRELAAGRDVLDALSIVQDSVGRAVVFSTLPLLVGFGVLCTSRLIPIVYFGVLVSISMIGGLLGNLFVLPLLLRIVTPASQTKPPSAPAATVEARRG